MECGTLSRLNLRIAARLQDAIRSLGKYKKGDKKMSEMIKTMEEQVIGTAKGVKPLITTKVMTEAVKSIAQHNNSQCRLLEHGLHESNRNSVIDYYKQLAEKNKKK